LKVVYLIYVSSNPLDSIWPAFILMDAVLNYLNRWIKFGASRG